MESTTGGHTWLRIAITEGRNRQIRRMVEALHHRVHRLIRIRFGPLVLGDLPPGRWRRLTDAELTALAAGKDAAGPAERRRTGTDARYKAGWARPKPQRPYRGARKNQTARGARKHQTARGARPA
jgi:23S rRNA pseudouridine2605 synthase